MKRRARASPQHHYHSYYDCAVCGNRLLTGDHYNSRHAERRQLDLFLTTEHQRRQAAIAYGRMERQSPTRRQDAVGEERRAIRGG